MAIPWRRCVNARKAVTRVVDERVDRERSVGDLVAQERGRRCIGQIAGYHMHLPAVLSLEPVAQRAQPRLAPRRHDEVEAFRSKNFGKSLADACRSACDERSAPRDALGNQARATSRDAAAMVC